MKYLDKIKPFFVVCRWGGFVDKSQVVAFPRVPDNVVLEFVFMPFKSFHHQNSRFHNSVQSAVVAVKPTQLIEW